MIQTGIKLKTIVDFLKENLSILIVIPAFLGGIWQAFELMSISMPYIRFFSISQIVSDGITILMLIIITSFVYLLIAILQFCIWIHEELIPNSLTGNNYDLYSHLLDGNNKLIRKKKFKKWLIFFIILYLFMVFYFVWSRFDKQNIFEFGFNVTLTILGILLLNIFLNKCYFLILDNYKFLIKFCNTFLIFLYLIILIKLSKQIKKQFMLPPNNVNIEQVKTDVANKFPNTKQELLYFNDKYIFFKIIDKIKMDRKGKVLKHNISEKIYIVKFEYLFNEKD